MTIREMSLADLAEIKGLFRDVFCAPPWNDDWRDERQLDEYMRDLMDVRHPLVYGLYQGGLIGVSIGRIKHWYAGTEYYIEELFLRGDCQGRGYGRAFLALIESRLSDMGVHGIYLTTDRDKPAYGFYKAAGFDEQPESVGFFRAF